MAETTVSLIQPLRAVLVADPRRPPPEWLVQQHARLPTSRRDLELARAEAARDAQLQQEILQLRQERDAWKRGLEELQRATRTSVQQTAASLAELQNVVIELAHAIASKLVFRQLNEGTFPIEQLVTEVLSRLGSVEDATVKMNPHDLAALQQNPAFVQGLSEGGVRLVADLRLNRGDCQAIAGEITVIYDLKRQIDEIRRELLSTVNGTC